MNKVLCTFGWGEAAKWLELTAPLMMKYAMMHGYDFYVDSYNPRFNRPPSWNKLELFRRFLSSDHENPGDYEGGHVLWLDADVVIKDFSKDIVDELPKNSYGMMANTTHQTDIHGFVPNCGVWLLRGSSYEYELLEDYKGRLSSKLESSMWEQARYCKLLGGTDEFPMSFPNGFPSWFQELPYEWNVTLWDKRGIPGNLRFFHATASRDPVEKLTLIKEWVNK